jgi:hydrogenase nickel incorporation protein HypB
MCKNCGCSNPEGFIINDKNHTHSPETAYNNEHAHSHTHEHSHSHTHTRLIDLDIDVLSRNNINAGMNRSFFEGRRIMCLNIVSSPGSGKTTILEKTIGQLVTSNKVFVIEGDQQTRIDAERIQKAGAPALQINTGSGCHLDAEMIAFAMKKTDIEANSILFIENVGNLVCPALFDLGEYKRIIVISVTEGEDKPLKYPKMFETSHLCLINKSDLLPYVEFSPAEFIKNAQLVNNGIEFIILSAKTGEGMNKWYGWISDQYENLPFREKFSE